MNTLRVGLLMGLVLAASLAASAPPAEATSVLCLQVEHEMEFQSLQPTLPLIAPAVLSEKLRDAGLGQDLQWEANDGLVYRATPYRELAYYDYQGETNGVYRYKVTGASDCDVQDSIVQILRCVGDPLHSCDVVGLLAELAEACTDASEAHGCWLREFVDWVVCRAEGHETCPDPSWDNSAP